MEATSSLLTKQTVVPRLQEQHCQSPNTSQSPYRTMQSDNMHHQHIVGIPTWWTELCQNKIAGGVQKCNVHEDNKKMSMQNAGYKYPWFNWEKWAAWDVGERHSQWAWSTIGPPIVDSCVGCCHAQIPGMFLCEMKARVCTTGAIGAHEMSSNLQANTKDRRRLCNTVWVSHWMC